MFNKKHRIPTDSLIPIIQADISVSGEILSLKSAINGLDLPRFAVIVSKNVSKFSVMRHLIKRRIVNLILKNISVFKNKDYAVFVRAKASGMSFGDLEQEFISFINKNEL